MRCGRAVRLITVKSCTITVNREGHLDGVGLAHWLTLAKQRALIRDHARRLSGLWLILSPAQRCCVAERGQRDEEEGYFF